MDAVYSVCVVYDVCVLKEEIIEEKMVNRWDDDVVTCNERWVGEQSLYTRKERRNVYLSLVDRSRRLYSMREKERIRKVDSIYIGWWTLYICLQTLRLVVSCRFPFACCVQWREREDFPWVHRCGWQITAHARVPIRDADESSRFLVVCNWKPANTTEITTK
jgi:hypothetical protein